MSYLTGDLQRQREAMLLEAARSMPLGMTTKQAADALGVSPAVARVSLRLARAHKVLVYIELGEYRRWADPLTADAISGRLAEEPGAQDGGQAALRFRREAAVLAALRDTPAGLTLKQIAEMLCTRELPASAVMRRASKRGDAVSVRVATTFRWAAPQHRATAIDAIHAERDAAKAERIEADDPLLTAKRTTVRAGAVPPPKTTAIRSIFDMGYQR